MRNKYCSICNRSENKDEPAPNHLCFKNWTGSSSAMEQDIIVEGFNNSIKMHNLRYKKFIADGDSSVYSKIKRNVFYGLQVHQLCIFILIHSCNYEFKTLLGTKS